MAGSDLMSGTLDLLILKSVKRGRLHGYAIGRWIRDKGGNLLGVEEGVLYPALHRLAQRGLLTSEWGRTETGRRAKFYSLTEAGEKALQSRSRRWEELSRSVLSVLKS